MIARKKRYHNLQREGLSLSNRMSASSKTRSVLIFGGAGFVGSNWAQHLLTKTDAKVHIFDNLSRSKVEHNLHWLQSLAQGTERLEISIADVRDKRAVEKAVSGASEIYHFAAQVAVTTSLDNPRSDFEINAGGTLNILEAARQSGNQPFLLFTSTNKVYGKIESACNGHAVASHCGVQECQPLDFYSPYGCSKGTADQYVHDYARIFGLPTVVFRMSCIAGPRQFGNEDQGWVAHFVYSALQGKTISIYGDGRQVRDVLAVSDLVRAFAAAHENRNTAGQVYNIGGGSENTVSLLELVNSMERLLDVQVRYRFRPARPGDQPIYVTDFAKFHKDTNWSPVRSVYQTVDDICSWYHDNQSLFSTTPFRLRSAKMHTAIFGEIAS
jgi:CDP-paratose 2-epimerase